MNELEHKISKILQEEQPITESEAQDLAHFICELPEIKRGQIEPLVINFLAEISKEIHANSKAKGFWEGEAANIPTKLMLIVSEISEAMEAHRKNNFFIRNIDGLNGWTSDEDFISHFEITCKDKFEDELADAVIRILDLAEHFNIDLSKHIKAKHRYNTTRQFMHGKKY